MKNILTATAAALALVALTATGCSKANASSNRVALLRAKAIAAPVVETAPVAPAATAAPGFVVVDEAPAAPAKRVKNPNVSGWEQLVPDMTKEEVEQFIGRPNAKNETKWVYKSGASVRFSDKGLLATYDAPRK
jgi:hypothetical protein